MFGIGAGEMVVIVVIGLLIVGPEKLPLMIRDGLAWVRDLRRLVEATRRDVSDTLGPELRDLGVRDVRDLDPRAYVRHQILDDLPGLDDDEPPVRPRANGATAAGPSGDGASAAGRRSSRAVRDEGAVPAYDPDTT